MEILDSLSTVTQDFALRAQEVDQNSTPPREHLEKLAALGYYRFVTTAEPGPRRRALDLLSASCGVTSFLSTQHSGVCRRLFKAEHPALPKAISGEKWFGVCFAHLRRTPSPVDALEFRDHVVFSGSGPWFSGFGLMTEVMVGGATEDGKFLMGLSKVDVPEILPKPPQPLAVMNATATVGLDFNALRVESADLIVRTDAEELQDRDKHSTVFQASRSLGAARAASQFLTHSGTQAVRAELDKHHSRMDAWDESPTWEGATTLRRQALELANKVVKAAFVQVGGRAHALNHPLQRISREAAFYSTTQLTGQLRKAIASQLENELEPQLS